jgi:hypothetical protein
LRDPSESDAFEVRVRWRSVAGVGSALVALPLAAGLTLQQVGLAVVAGALLTVLGVAAGYGSATLLHRTQRLRFELRQSSRMRGPNRSRKLLRTAGALLPVLEREHHIEEWLDHVEAARENGYDVRPVVRSILLHAVPRVVFRAWIRRLRAALARR